MAKQLLKDNFTPTTFEIDGIKFIECDYEKEFTIRMDNIARKIMSDVTKFSDNPTLDEIHTHYNVNELLALCTKVEGSKWTIEQYEKNKDFFLDSQFPTEGENIIRNFFSFAGKLILRGFPTS